MVPHRPPGSWPPPRPRHPFTRAGIALLGITGSLLASPPTPAAPPPPPSTPTPARGTPPPNGPRIVFLQPVHDFGKVIAGQVLHHRFVFTNLGQQVLELHSVRSTCGCATSTGWPQRVEPGQGGAIPLELHTSGLENAVTKPVHIVSNDPIQPTLALQIKADVWHPIKVSPPSAGLRLVGESPSNLTAVVRLTNREPALLSLSPPECEPASIKAELTTIEPGRVFELAVRPTGPLAVGNVFGKATLRTSSTNLPVLSIPVWIIVQPSVTVLPAQFTLPPLPPSTSFTQDVSIRSFGPAPLALSQPSLDLPNVQVQLVELQPGKLFAARLVFPPQFTLPPDRLAELRLRSNQPQSPLLRIPIVAAPQ